MKGKLKPILACIIQVFQFLTEKTILYSKDIELVYLFNPARYLHTKH
jgi:hypothetical protein